MHETLAQQWQEKTAAAGTEPSTKTEAFSHAWRPAGSSSLGEKWLNAWEDPPAKKPARASRARR